MNDNPEEYEVPEYLGLRRDLPFIEDDEGQWGDLIG